MVGIFKYNVGYGKLVHDPINYNIKVNVCDMFHFYNNCNERTYYHVENDNDDM